MDFQKKYFKYKNKYLRNKMVGGGKHSTKTYKSFSIKSDELENFNITDEDFNNLPDTIIKVCRDHFTKLNSTVNTPSENFVYKTYLHDLYPASQLPFISTTASLSVAYEFSLKKLNFGDIMCIGEYTIPDTELINDETKLIEHLTNKTHKSKVTVFNMTEILSKLLNDEENLKVFNDLQYKMRNINDTTNKNSTLWEYIKFLRVYDIIGNADTYLTKMYIFKIDTFDTMHLYERYKNNRYSNNQDYIPEYRVGPILCNKILPMKIPELDKQKEKYIIMNLNLNNGFDIMGIKGENPDEQKYQPKTTTKISENEYIPNENEVLKTEVFKKIIIRYECDIICIQQFSCEDTQFKKYINDIFKSYDIYSINNYSENIAILVNKIYKTTKDDIGVISACRNYILIKIYSLNITILNVHLCGESDIVEGSPKPSRDIDFLLTLYPRIDLICGDFNGNWDAHGWSTDQYLEQNMKKDLKEWILKPFETLEKNGYDNDNNKGTTINMNSGFSTRENFIYFNKSTINWAIEKQINLMGFTQRELSPYKWSELGNTKISEEVKQNYIENRLSNHQGNLLTFEINSEKSPLYESYDKQLLIQY